LDYAQVEHSAGRRSTGFLIVVVLHIVLGYALVTGLARKVVEVIKAPLETKIIEEMKKPPPDTPPPPPPKMAPPPPPYIPPPEVNIQVPAIAQQAATITTTTVAPPQKAFVPQVAPPVQQATVRKEYKASHRVNPTYPRQAIQQGIANGRVIAHVVVAPNGAVTEVRIISATPPRVFDREVIRALSQWKFNPEPVGFIGEYEIEFKLTD